MTEASLAAMAAEIVAEPDSVCGMSKRVGQMSESQLEIYVDFLEKRRQSQVGNRRLREAIGTILEEARSQLRERRAENAEMRERGALISQRMEEQRMKDEKDLEEREKVLESVRKHCQELAAREVQAANEESRRRYRKLGSVREARARVVVRTHQVLALCLAGAATFAIAATADGDVPVLVLGSCLAFVLIVIGIFVNWLGRWRAKGLRAPWREDDDETERRTKRRAEDLMIKWEIEQERVRREISKKSNDPKKNRRPSVEERVARAKVLAKETRTANARKRHLLMSQNSSKVYPQGEQENEMSEEVSTVNNI